jgi:hypothetical protein
MRILWDPRTNNIFLTLNGVGVELDIPDTLYFKGWVSMSRPAPNVFRFDGDITLKLVALNLEIEAQLVIGYNADAGYTFFAIYLGVELPAGIPLARPASPSTEWPACLPSTWNPAVFPKKPATPFSRPRAGTIRHPKWAWPTCGNGTRRTEASRWARASPSAP